VTVAVENLLLAAMSDGMEIKQTNQFLRSAELGAPSER